MPIVRGTDCVPLPMVVCPVVAVVMLESRVASCVQCVENVACYAGPKHVEIILISNKSPFVASSWSHTYLLIKDARSLEHKVYNVMFENGYSLSDWEKRGGVLFMRVPLK